ncbi:MAG: replication terminator protein [Clostridiaceae bacterium]
MDKLNIANIARGALLERADIEIDNVLKNILDKNTDWRKARKVTLEIGFKPTDESRENVFVELKAKSTVSPYNPVLTQLFVGKDNDGRVVAEEHIRNKDVIPGQTGIPCDKETGEIIEPIGSGTGRKIVNINR